MIRRYEHGVRANLPWPHGSHFDYRDYSENAPVLTLSKATRADEKTPCLRREARFTDCRKGSFHLVEPAVRQWDAVDQNYECCLAKGHDPSRRAPGDFRQTPERRVFTLRGVGFDGMAAFLLKLHMQKFASRSSRERHSHTT